jgi:hypothetical protein
MVDLAVEIAPADPEPLLAYWLNRLPPVWRMRVGDRVNETIDRRRVLSLASARLQPLEIFAYEDAEVLVKDLRQTLAGKVSAQDEARYMRVFGNDDFTFSPLYYTQPWSTGLDAIPLSPSEARTALGLSDDEIEDLTNDVAALLADASRGSVIRLVGNAEHEDKRALRVAVAPFTDTLIIPALLYAVSDLQDMNIEFLPASFFYHQGKAKYLGEASAFDVGYCVEADRSTLARTSHVHSIFNEGITRSILLRQDSASQTGFTATPVLHISMIGRFAPEGTFSVDGRFTEPSLIEKFGTKLIIPEDLVGSEHLQPTMDWELPLILAMAAGTRQHSGEPLVGVTISTDSHVWACHTGLINPSVKGPIDAFALIGGLGSERLKLIRAGWQPGQSEGSSLDRHAQLCWHFPKLNDSALASAIRDRWEALWRKRILSPLQKLSISALFDRRSKVPIHDQLRENRDGARDLCRALTAPLFSVFPDYRGAIWQLPPEAWSRKLFGPDDHLHYEPYWHRALKGYEKRIAIAGPSELARDS